MAIYHLTAKTVSRGSGSANARSQYIDREGRYAKDHEEVLYKTSGNMPEWANENRKYWEAADLYERENGRLFKQLEFSLPKELKPEEQKELVQAYVSELTITKDGKLPYSYAIHKGHDRENPHCHLMISERAQDGHERNPETWFKRANRKAPEQGGAKKTTALMPKEWLQNVRETWEKEANKALERAGYEERIDHRSLEEQGINRQPTRHRGVALNSMLKSGKLTLQEIVKPLEAEANKEKELAEAVDLKVLIAQGISEARQGYTDERSRQQEEKIEQQAQERKIQEALQELMKTRDKGKNRGMGFSR